MSRSFPVWSLDMEFVADISGGPIPLAERSKAWVCSRSPAGIACSNPAGGMDVCLL